MRCWKFYCEDHGDEVCSVCRQKAEEDRLRGSRLVLELSSQAMRHPRGFLRSLLPGRKLILGEFGRSTEPTEAELARTKLGFIEGLELKRIVPIAKSAEWGQRQLMLI